VQFHAGFFFNLIPLTEPQWLCKICATKTHSKMSLPF
jgi:hypothetical protein